MTTTAILLIIGSAIIHASWNLLCKKSNSSTSFFLIASIPSCLLLLPFVLTMFHLIRFIPSEVWWLLALTGCFQATYYIGLAKAYKHGDISVVYPVARTLPVLIVATAVYLFSGGTQALSHESLFGALLIIGGCFMLPMRHLRDFRLKNYINIACFFAVIAAIGTSGYSVIDDKATEVLRINFSSKENIALITLLYIFFETISSSIWMGIYILVNKNERESFKLTVKNNKLTAFGAGFAITLAYSMVLMSMAFVTNVSYVVAFRQLGIFIGAVMGIVLLGEAKQVPKIIGICLLFIGLLLVALG
ncbi:MAG: EamA family transporter [Lentisphaerota bacterium]